MSEIVNCEYSKTIMDEPTCNAFDVNRYGEIICSEENCIILKLKEQLQAKEQECKELKEKLERQKDYTVSYKSYIYEKEKQIKQQLDQYKQALDEIEKICQIKEENSQFVLPSVWQQILDIIQKAKDSKQ